MKRPRGTPPGRPSALLAMVRPDLVYDRNRYRCTACGRRRIRRAFGDNKSRPDGRALQCRQCKAEASTRARARSKREISKLRNLATRPGFHMERRRLRPGDKERTLTHLPRTKTATGWRSPIHPRKNG